MPNGRGGRCEPHRGVHPPDLPFALAAASAPPGNAMSAHPPRPLVFDLRGRGIAAAWCAARGPAWGAETILADDGTLALGLTTPASGDALAYLLRRTADGVALIEGRTGDCIGVFAALGHALSAVAEAAEAQNAAEADEEARRDNSVLPGEIMATALEEWAILAPSSGLISRRRAE